MQSAESLMRGYHAPCLLPMQHTWYRPLLLILQACHYWTPAVVLVLEWLISITSIKVNEGGHPGCWHINIWLEIFGITDILEHCWLCLWWLLSTQISQGAADMDQRFVGLFTVLFMYTWSCWVMRLWPYWPSFIVKPFLWAVMKLLINKFLKWEKCP